MHEFNITLFRDSLSTQWGIRLEGGREFGTPLTIQRVFAGTPASGDLQRGDVIVLVQHRDASQLTHQEANEIIKNSGGSVSFTIRRGGEQSYTTVQQMSGTRPHQHAVNFGPPKHAMTKSVNYAPFAPSHLYEAEDPLQSYIRSRPIEKVKNPKPILSQTGSPIMPGDTPSMQSRAQMRRFRPASTLPMLGSPKQGGYSNSPYYDGPSYSPTSPNQFTYTQAAPQVSTYSPSQPLVYPYNNAHLNSTPVPFSERKMATQLQHSLTRAAANKFNAPPQHHYQQQQQQPAYHPVQPVSAFPFAPSSIQHKPQQHHHHQTEPYTPPPWKDSLKNSFEPAPHSPNNFHMGGGSPSTPKTPKVVNLQYNTPIGLYSRENIQQELHRQVGNANLPFVPASEF